MMVMLMTIIIIIIFTLPAFHVIVRNLAKE
jgi:hypothetical protein